MKLSEKIYYCRKRDGKSQEALAEQIGVSRQSISKWENAEAEPEIAKLKMLADAFGVTVDWLLSDEEPVTDAYEDASEKYEDTYSDSAYTYYNNSGYGNTQSNWVDSVPGVIGKLLRKYGWLAGVYLAIAGAGFTFIGGLVRIMTKSMNNMFDKSVNSMFDSFGGFGGMSNGMYFDDAFTSQMNNTVSGFASNNPIMIFGAVVMGIGIVMIIAGIILAVVLKKKSAE